MVKAYPNGGGSLTNCCSRNLFDNVWALIILIVSSNPSCLVADNNQTEGPQPHAESLLSDIWALTTAYTFATKDHNYTFPPPPPIQTCANIYAHHPCTNHSVPSITAQMDWVQMVRNTSCPMCNTKEESFPAVWQGIHQHQLNVSPLSPVTKSESYWMCSMKHVPADSCFLFRNFPLVMSMAVCDWWGYGSPLSRFNTCYLEHKNNSGGLKVTI